MGSDVVWNLSGAEPVSEEAEATTATSEAAASEEPKPQELQQLIAEHGDSVFRLAVSITRDRSLAEDVTQEAFVKAWLGLATFRGDCSLRSWVLRIARNTAISSLRARKAAVVDPQHFDDSFANSPVAPEISVEKRVQSHAVMKDFVAALDVLDELSRSIVVLRELEGLSYEEIVDTLGVPLPTVKTRLLRARRRLSVALQEWA